MAPVELDFYTRIPGADRDAEDAFELSGNDSVSRGCHTVIKDFYPATLIVFCNQENSKGTLVVRGDSDHLGVSLFSTEQDEFGRALNHEHPIDFSGQETIQVDSDTCDTSIIIYHDREEDQDQQEETTAQKVLVHA